VPLLDRASWVELAGGATVKIGPNWTAYAQAGYQFATASSNVRRDGVSGQFGLRYGW
jgi:outer membrane autotransporter protein